MRRRAFIAGIAGSAAWQLAARAQEKVRRVGVLLPATADDAEFQARLGAFQQGLGKLGWEIGRNVRIDSRWATTNAVEIQRRAAGWRIAGRLRPVAGSLCRAASMTIRIAMG